MFLSMLACRMLSVIKNDKLIASIWFENNGGGRGSGV